MSSLPPGAEQIRSFCVDDPEVALVIDADTGGVLTAQDVLSGDEGDVVKRDVDVSQRLAADKPRFLCALCHVPVYIVCLPHRPRRFFFRHTIEDGRCSALTRGSLSEAQINAIKYDGQKEGPDHLRIKAQIQRSLECDTSFSDVQPEKYIRGTEPGTWRKPDVSGVYRGLRVCFEAQLSTTFLRVMAERRNFYLKENAALIWIFKDFPRDSRRLLKDAIFYANNRNVFIVNSQTLEESRRQGCFVMLCLWCQPFLVGDQLDFEWHEQLTCFDRLTIDLERQRVFLFDCEGEAAHLRKLAWDASWLGRFECYWTTTPPDELRVYDGWQKIRQGRGERDGLWADRYPKDESALRGLLNGLYSLKVGRPVGWRLPTLVQVVHRSLDTSPDSMGILARAVEQYCRVEQLHDEDKSGKLALKICTMAGTSAPDGAIDWHQISGRSNTNALDSLLVELFPELYGCPRFYLHPSKRRLRGGL